MSLRCKMSVDTPRGKMICGKAPMVGCNGDWREQQICPFWNTNIRDNVEE